MGLRHFYDAIRARIQLMESKHFELTPYGKSLSKLKGSHIGESCFVIGNGPSLTATDLQVLHEKNVSCFGTNRIFKIFNETDWRPTFFVSEDIIIIKNIQHEIETIQSQKKFIPINLKWYEGVDIKGADYFYMDYRSDLTDNYGMSLDVPHCIHCHATVTTTCLQIAVYMGFSNIYLLGVDHNFAKMIDKNGNVVMDKTIKNHFSNDYDKDIIDQGFQIDGATEAYINLERLSRKLGSFRIYNATRGGKLEVFERVNFDTLVF